MTIEGMLKALVRREGAFSHLQADKGGATRFGITQGTLSFWRKAPASVADVKALTEDEAVEIYRQLYYINTHIDQLPEPLDDLVFDFAVNSGPQLAIAALQECLHVPVDGRIGPVTLVHTLAADSAQLQKAVVRWRIMMFARIVKRDPSQLVFLAGWLSRALEFI